MTELQACYMLEEAGRTPFSEFDFAVQCWTIDKDKFGLTNYAILIDTRNCKSALQGLIRKGLIAKVEKDNYRLTMKGRRKATDYPILHRTPATSRIPSSIETLLTNALESDAYIKEIQDISFRDAVEFWSGCPTTFNRMVAFAASVDEIVLSNGQSLVWADLWKLLKLSESLEIKFKQHLILMEKQTNVQK